ncbi:MAG: hypothetical protein WED34_06270 [Planctomycetales bacterium]
MNADSIRPGLSGDDDSWEDLARDLLGVDINQPPAVDDTGEELPYPEPMFPAGARPEDAPSAEAREAAGREPDLPVDADEPDEAEFAAQEPTAEPAAPDSYWDALQDWDWDGETESSRRGPRREDAGEKRQPAAPAAGERRPRPAPAEAPRAADKEAIEARRREFLEDSDFGAGLLEERPPSPRKSIESRRPAAERPVERAEPSVERAEAPVERVAEEEAGEEGPRRRRRRRRRPRDGEREAAGAEAPSARPSAPREAAEEEFGEAVEAEPAEPAAEAGPGETTGEPKRRRRRRRRRGGEREPRAAQPEAAEGREEAEVEEEGFAEEGFAEEGFAEPEPVTARTGDVSEGPESEEEAPHSYRSIPSWEEAISYLTKGRTEEGKSRQSAESRPRGGRRRRKR